jgi:nucleoside-diphosphate-sugar epimerase
MKKICITGANGFIGKTLCKSLKANNNHIQGFVRAMDLYNNSSKTEYISVGDIGSKTNWKDHLNGFDCVIHCAGLTHQMSSIKDINIYNLVNIDGTKRLAEKSVEAGIKRLVFLSSVKVNGESTYQINMKQKFSYKDKPNPQDLYAKSKLGAEKALWEISSRTGLEVVVVRLPLVYGYGVKGNLERLIKLVKSGIPLPLSLVKNKRSMIGMDNLVDLLIRCIDHPEARGKTFLASDGEDLSTPELIKLIASSMEKKANLFPFPISMLKFLASVLGKREEINRLVGSLRIDGSYTKEILNWTPTISVEEGIRRMVQRK